MIDNILECKFLNLFENIVRYMNNQSFITVCVKNHSSRKTLRQHQNNILKQIYSPVRNYRGSIRFPRGSKFYYNSVSQSQTQKTTQKSIQYVPEQNKKHVEKKSKRKTFKKQIRRGIKNLKKCTFDDYGADEEEGLMGKLSSIQTILDYDRIKRYDRGKDEKSIIEKGWVELQKNKKLSNRACKSIHLAREKKKSECTCFNKVSHASQTQNSHNPQHLCWENPAQLVHFTEGWVGEYDKSINGRNISLNMLNRKLKTNKSLYNAYHNVKHSQKVESFDISHQKRNSFVSVVAVNQRVKKIGRLTPKIQNKINELQIIY